MNRAYSVLHVRSINDGERVIEGVASTPTPDRMGDIVDPLGAKFALPMPLLWQHDSRQPIGQVTFAKPTKDGIPFRAKLATVAEPGALKDRLDMAWQSIKAGLVRAVSIGFQALSYEILKDGGYKFTSWEWLELSAVTIPANADATITTIRSFDRQQRAASGQSVRTVRTAPGVSGQPLTGAPEMQTITQQIADQEAKRASLADRMKSFGDVTQLDDEQAEAYDEARAALKDCDTTLGRLKDMQQAVTGAVAVRGVVDPDSGSRQRGSLPAQVRAPELPKGTLFARYAMAVAAGKGSFSDTVAFAKRWDPQTPEVSAYIKAVAGQSQPESPGWGSELVFQNNLASEFIELLRPMTIIGRIAGFRRVPFNVRIPKQTGGSTVNWVGEVQPKPVTELAFGEVLLGYTKIAGIVVLSEELVRLSSPSAEETVRRDLTSQIAQFMDEQFLDPNVTVSSSNPASITSNVTPVSASGTDADALYFDLNAALATFDDAEEDGNPVIIMPRALARGISTLRNALGQFEFSGMSATGGTLNGAQVIVSNSCPSGTLVLVLANEILLADDGGVRLDASSQATLDMSGSTNANFSLWQNNLVGIRAERWVNYQLRRDSAVAMIDGAAYGPQGDSPI